MEIRGVSPEEQMAQKYSLIAEKSNLLLNAVALQIKAMGVSGEQLNELFIDITRLEVSRFSQTVDAARNLQNKYHTSIHFFELRECEALFRILLKLRGGSSDDQPRGMVAPAPKPEKRMIKTPSLDIKSTESINETVPLTLSPEEIEGIRSC